MELSMCVCVCVCRWPQTIREKQHESLAAQGTRYFFFIFYIQFQFQFDKIASDYKSARTVVSGQKARQATLSIRHVYRPSPPLIYNLSRILTPTFTNTYIHM